ncbi:hypothetical protein BFG57_03880 [Bacillus solimangrovi]|uniref:Uncharacterized protein n=1 Tax=Bacillus solimangrovi TaxID=1305675 RepID=A0A1E5LCU0_9BACI|nr:hypothetical protein BFG57_03880 [Bacillus solimangrovi]
MVESVEFTLEQALGPRYNKASKGVPVVTAIVMKLERTVNELRLLLKRVVPRIPTSSLILGAEFFCVLEKLAVYFAYVNWR